jgi:uncharacterized lipoprotein YddW (UPF0748 family)
LSSKLNQRRRLCKAAGVAALLAFGGISCTSVKTLPPVPPVPLKPTPPKPTLTPKVASAVPVPPPTGEQPPAAPREFRAAWVSTVANIDWPSRSNLPVVRQQAEAIAILDRAVALNLNAIVLQVRPSADAIYPSSLEPWSEFLTGQQGRAPQPMYDPLEFWINEAHARGLELHAWFNPYRARHATAKTPLAASHVANKLPQTVKPYGRSLWMDPGEAAAARHTQDVILDVVRRYDIDGVHLDDYFYPYPVDAGVGDAPESDAGSKPRAQLEFPDQLSWQHYLLGGGELTRANWRRRNVNLLIESLHQGIQREKSWVRFGISPFGIGRPDLRPPGIVGFSQYDLLYADVELWLAKGWLDYLVPQLYWPLVQKPQAFDVLLDYWLAQNPLERHIWPGLFTSRIDNSARSFPAEEIVQQVALTRTRSGVNGHVHFSFVALMENRKGIGDQLMASTYQSAALVPATPWLGSQVPAAPALQVRRTGHGYSLSLKKVPGMLPATGVTPGVTRYAIWSRYGLEWRFATVPAPLIVWQIADDAIKGPPSAIVVSAVDRLGNESARVDVLSMPVASVAL